MTNPAAKAINNAIRVQFDRRMDRAGLSAVGAGFSTESTRAGIGWETIR
jgi:hypothetical protein